MVNRIESKEDLGWVANYPYGDIKILIYHMSVEGDMEVLIREGVEIPLDETRGYTLQDHDGNVLEHHEHGHLKAEKHYAQIEPPLWYACDVDQIEHQARLAETFGLHLVAQEAREEIAKRIAEGGLIGTG